VVILSVTEGEDKPLKYPGAFISADCIVVTKIDLAEAVEFDMGVLPKRTLPQSTLVFRCSTPRRAPAQGWTTGSPGSMRGGMKRWQWELLLLVHVQV
jgi:hypothetical protein